jgi:hypothetical protein
MEIQAGAIVCVLRHAGYCRSVHAQARTFGREHLDSAMTVVSQFPRKWGTLLMELSLKLRLLLLVKSD